MMSSKLPSQQSIALSLRTWVVGCLVSWLSGFSAYASEDFSEGVVDKSGGVVDKAARQISLPELTDRLASQSGGIIQPSPHFPAFCQPGSGNDCERWIEKRFNQVTYWDLKSADLDEDQLQQLFETRWESSRYGNQSFLDWKEQQYSTFQYRPRDFRYTLPFPVVRGWWGLNHPPLRTLDRPLEEYHPKLGEIDRDSDHPFYDAEFQRRLDAKTGTQITAGNVVSLLTNNDSYQAKLDLINRAQKRLWVTTMVFYCDASSSKLIDAMKARARAGVDVKVIIEGLWSRIILNGCISRMRKAGLDVLVLTESIMPHSFTHLTHSKFWIRDGEEAIVGGQNLMDSENLASGFDGGARDTDAHIHRGPAATDLANKFAEIWEMRRKRKNRPMGVALTEIQNRIYSEQAQGLRGERVYDEILRDPKLRHQGVCRVVSQGPGESRATITPMLIEYTDAAQDFVFMTSPRMKWKPNKRPSSYPSGPIYQSMIDAANRGVRLDFITNGVDGFAGDLTGLSRRLAERARENGWSFLERIAWSFSDSLARLYFLGSLKVHEQFRKRSENIHIWNYFRFAHQKVHFWDRRVVGIGSFNLDGHSARGNRETELFCMDDRLVGQVEAMIARDLSNSVPVHGSGVSSPAQRDLASVDDSDL